MNPCKYVVFYWINTVPQLNFITFLLFLQLISAFFTLWIFKANCVCCREVCIKSRWQMTAVQPKRTEWFTMSLSHAGSGASTEVCIITRLFNEGKMIFQSLSMMFIVCIFSVPSPRPDNSFHESSGVTMDGSHNIHQQPYDPWWGHSSSHTCD